MTGATSTVLDPAATVLEGRARTREDAITEAGGLLVAAGAVEQGYVEAMHEREASVSTCMGNLLAIPHGTNAAKAAIRRTAVAYVRYPDGLDWGGQPVEFVVAVAGAGDDHLTLLSQLAGVFTDEERLARLRLATSYDEVCGVLDEA